METQNGEKLNPENFTTVTEFWKYFAQTLKQTSEESYRFALAKQNYCWAVLALTQTVPIAIREEDKKNEVKAKIFNMFYQEGLGIENHRSYSAWRNEEEKAEQIELFTPLDIETFEKAVKPFLEERYKESEKPRITIGSLRLIADTSLLFSDSEA